jgi:hypothetical protein
VAGITSKRLIRHGKLFVIGYRMRDFHLLSREKRKKFPVPEVRVAAR